MSRSFVSLFFLAAAYCVFAPAAFAQDDKKVLAEVTVRAVDPIYTSIRTLSSLGDAFSGDYAAVTNVALKKDAAVFTLLSGEIYFLKPVEGKTTGAVFIGSGEFSLTPPVEVERQHLAIFVDGPTVREGFDGLTMFFTDDTFETIKGLPGVRMGKSGPQAEKARSTFRDKEKLVRDQFRYNITSRILSDLYAPGRSGFFSVFIDGQKFGKLLYGIDPLGHSEVYPEQVELISYGETTGGIWTAFHMEAEYKKGHGDKLG